MKRSIGKIAVLLAAAGSTWMLGVSPLRAAELGADAEEDGVTVPQGHKEAYEAAKEQMKEAPREEHKSGSWFLAGFMGMGFPQTDSAQYIYPAFHNLPAETIPYGLTYNFSFMGGLQGGYYWHDPDKWGNLSFSAEAFGAYLGGSNSNTSLAPGVPRIIAGQSINLGLLGLGGTLGYRIANSWEPYIGFYGGGVIGNLSLDIINYGNVWGYWFAPAVGLRYFVPNSHWFVALQGMFLFMNDLNGLSTPVNTYGYPAIVNLSSGNGYLYAPVAMFTVGYAF